MTQIRSGRLLSNYVKKNALFAMLFAILGLWALQVVFSYLSELEDFSDTYTYADALRYIMYRSPYFLEQFIPTGALLGAVVGLGLLANQSELIVMRASGVSIYRIVAWVLQPAFIFVLVALAVNQYVLPTSNHLAEQVRKPDTPLLASVSGYWTMQKPQNQSNDATKQPDSKAQGGDIIFIEYADANGNIGEVKRWHLDANNNLTSVSKASGGVYLPNKSVTTTSTETSQYQWRLNDVVTLNLAERSAINTASSNTADTKAKNTQHSTNIVLNNTPLAQTQTQASDTISLPIDPSSVYLLTRRAEDLSLTQLYQHKRFNASQGTRSLEHELAFWQKLLSPFSILSLVIVACSFVFGSLRSHSLGLRIVVALLFGLLFSYIQDLTGFISLATGISPLIMVLLPIISSALLGLYLIKRQS